jgi:predicted MFS family arabinose efflux permease
VAIELQKKNKNSLQAISSISTWWDLGSALGAFIGIMAIDYLGTQNLFLSLTIVITLLFIIYSIQNAKPNCSTL